MTQCRGAWRQRCAWRAGLRGNVGVCWSQAKEGADSPPDGVVSKGECQAQHDAPAALQSQHVDVCTNGPSLPASRPAAMITTMPMSLAKKVRMASRPARGVRRSGCQRIWMKANTNRPMALSTRVKVRHNMMLGSFAVTAGAHWMLH